MIFLWGIFDAHVLAYTLRSRSFPKRISGQARALHLSILKQPANQACQKEKIKKSRPELPGRLFKLQTWKSSVREDLGVIAAADIVLQVIDRCFLVFDNRFDHVTDRDDPD